MDHQNTIWGVSQGDVLARIPLAWKSSSNQRESNILSEIYGKYQQ